MEFESTLERKDKKHAEHLKEAQAKGYKNELLDKVFKLVSSSNTVEYLQFRATDIAKAIQPSITSKDLRIARNMMCAMATQLVLNLIDEGLVNINK